MKIMVRKSLSVCWLIVVSLLAFLAFESLAQGKGPKQKPKPAGCDGNGYSTEVQADENSNGCKEYVLTVSNDGTSRYGLSHYTVNVPCGEISNLRNSENWDQEFGKDPTTGLFGFKIDNISGFGGKEPQSFTVSFTLCNANCEEQLIIAAYKAGQCVDYDTLSIPSDNPDIPGDTTDIPGDSTDIPGDTTDIPGDSTITCSTLTASIQKVNASCFGVADGRLTAAITDGVEPFVFSWSTGATTSTIENLQTGDYSVTITDADGNVLTLSAEITGPPIITISESLVNPSCNGLSNGSVDLSVSGGNGPYTYSWSNGATTEDLLALAAGAYRVSVQDVSGCNVQKTFTLTNSTSINQGVVLTHTSCAQPNGAINITVSGGASPYTYLWSNGATSEDIQNVVAGNYSVTVTDANGCIRQTPYTLRDESAVKITSSVSPTSCLDDASGAIDLQVSGGTSPYTFSWLDGPATEDRTGLTAALYRVTVTDATGCSATANITVFKKVFQVSSEVIQPTCSSGTGSITINPIDGVSPYTYVWSNVETGNSITDLLDGLYSVTITDASGCSRTLLFSITAPTALSASVMVSNSQCGEEGSFSIDLTVSGGKSPYTYLWSNNSVSEDISGLISGTYSVQITDANGCTASQDVVIEPMTISWSCLISTPLSPIVCGSVGNILTASVLDADFYEWSVTSSDNSWSITAGASSASMIYSAGSINSTATFTLTLSKEGCTKSCSFIIETNGCVAKDNTGGGDPANGDPCATSIVQEDNDQPATEDAAPIEESTTSEFRLSAYPNPFESKLTIELVADADGPVNVEILDAMGKQVSEIYAGNVSKGESYKMELDTQLLRDRLYFYRYTSSGGKQVTGKLIRK